MPQCPRAPRHSYSADSTRLFVATCDHCGTSRSYRRKNHQISKYLKYRRIKRRELGLLNVAVPLDSNSASSLTTAASECGLVSSASGIPHVTYAEGLRPESFHRGGGGLGEAVEALRDALRSEPGLTVVRVHSVPRRDGKTDLVLADVAVERAVGDAAGRVCSTSSPSFDKDGDGGGGAAFHRKHGGGGGGNRAAWCALPQFPYHVALGACAKKNVSTALAATSKRMLGMKLRIDAGRMKVLAPSAERRESGGEQAQAQGQGQGRGGSTPKTILRRRAPGASDDAAAKRGSLSDGHLSDKENNASNELEKSEVKQASSTLPEDDDTSSEDSTLPLVSPEDSDDDDFGLAVDLSFLDEAIPSPIMVRRPKMRSKVRAAVEEEGPPSWQDPTCHGPLSTAPFVNVPVPSPPPPRQEPAQKKIEQAQQCAAATAPKDHQCKRGATSKTGRFLTRCIPGRKGQVAPIPQDSNNARAMQPARVSASYPPTPPPPPKQQQLQPQPWMTAPPTNDFDQPLYYHHNGIVHQQQQLLQQSSSSQQPQSYPPLAMYDRQPMYDTDQLYQLYGQPVAPQPYAVENGYVTWVRTTPLTYEPLFVPNGGGMQGGGGGGGYGAEQAQLVP
uniref:Uncharacterized protein n=1 Tax=Odontella aurita TaxID=265563 RepID=A0A7S4IZ57_9STRA|mmetsp:Transcript_3349/g.8666  ORF Transcript_3349/g.8666 Transcript_3349/m.8666 type:complete len:616 (+) Transcript_3349:605-2452(+)|eukprot:CAMPEP_0113556410 /NCGR_PEP_ID=MMETSP0015_2-20120614/17242_1 /TAXON_ID=2838 /ORGANISM="Odontella" /LENGTH=615 /DNA_ID=CAMNT_0000457765 /DNA_START=501 /DNA_END=2348 /DNA_ORIENTATION=+ /assembly_acc=CAM_ASM_000160